MKGFLKSYYLKFKLVLLQFLKICLTFFGIINTLLSLCLVLLAVYTLGFDTQIETAHTLLFIRISFFCFFAELSILFLKVFSSETNKNYSFQVIFYVIYFIIAIVQLLPLSVAESYYTLDFIRQPLVLIIITIVQAFLKLSGVITQSLRQRINPAIIFVGSFFLLILIGTGLLMLPKATQHPINIIQALFTATSAVCVTGLTIVDVSQTFTSMGEIIILLLIQLGGIGIMTFTSFFGLFYMGKHITQNKLLIKDMVAPDNSVNQIVSTLGSILFITFSIEAIGVLLIFESIGGHSLDDLYFAIFHSISAFCNAGFSTLSQGLMDASVGTNYTLHFWIACLIIVGGLGFPIIFNLFNFVKHLIINTFRKWFGKRREYVHTPHLVTSNTVIVLVMTVILLLSGTLVFYLTEYNHTLADLDTKGKLITAFFMSVTPRTAGFNTFDMGGLSHLTILWMILFMWIGASPMSTGGGIKTTTLGIAILNIISTLRGRDHIEIRKRQIAASTVNRAFVIILVSLCVISIGVLLISFFDPKIDLTSIIFEVISAMSTVGLSLNITPLLSINSHIVLIALMFVGRVGLLTILSCIIKPQSQRFYQYPSESIPIN